MKSSERTRVLTFLNDHVVGKSVAAAPVTTRTDQGRITGAYEEDSVFSNLVETANGFSYDMTTLSRGTRYVPGKNGQELLAEGTLNAVRVLRYEITERKSSGKLLGYARFLSSTNPFDPLAGTIFLVRIWLEHGVLTVHESLAGYADLVSAEGTFKPASLDGTHRFAVEDGKLVVRFEQETFDVDPETLRRTPTGEKFELQVSHEVEFPPQLEEALEEAVY